MRKIFAALVLMISATAWAGDYEDGLAAYNKGDFATAASLFKKAARSGDSYAQKDLSIMYLQGQGVEKNFIKAAYWSKLAAEKGLALAQNNLGSMYQQGLGVAQDSAEAMRLYELAAEQGFADALDLVKKVDI